MLDEDRHETLERAQYGAMEPPTLPRPILGGVVQIEPLRLLKSAGMVAH
jgi:hypothetical protein